MKKLISSERSRGRTKTLAAATLVSLAGGFVLAASAQAADLSVDSLKDPLPDTLTWHGVTLYGTVDVGYSYQTNGAPQSAFFYTGGLDWNMYGSKQNRESVSALTGNALEQSKVGLKWDEQIGYGFSTVGKLETNFNPWSGEIADACKSLTENNGKATNIWTSGLDGSRCGQAFTLAYAGLSHPGYGTLTIGRQSSLQNDTVGTYDPMGGSYALSLIGWSGGADGGIGSTETARWDNSIKYLVSYGPVHAAGMYATGSTNSSILNDAYAADFGFHYNGFALDTVYTKENGAIGVKPLGTLGSDQLNGTISDNESYSVQAKYTYKFANGFKDDEPSAKLTFYGGYVHMDLTAPGSTFSSTGQYNSGGYSIASLASAVNPGSTKTLQTEYAGAKYETGPWAFTGAYYHLSQDAFNGEHCSNESNSACSGETNTVSGLIDYTFNKHFDVYTGVAWSDVSGGLANGFVANASRENTTWVSGLRLKF